MGPDPFNMPSAGAAGNHAALQQTINQMAPYATIWHGPMQGASIPQITPDMFTSGQPKSSSGGALSKFAHFIGGVGTEIGHLAGGAATWLAHNVVQGVEAPFKTGASIGTGILDRNSISSINAENTQLSGKFDNLMNQFHSGLISSAEYKQALKQLNDDLANNSRAATALDNKVKTDQQQATTNLINTVADALVFAAPNIEAGAAAARTFIFGKGAETLLAEAQSNLGRIAANETLFKGLSEGAQQALQHATAEVVANSAKMSAGDIARSAVMNLAIKYPIYYNYLSSTGGEIYNQLDNKKYGDAVRTVAFNAALLLSGGPIGQALKYGKSGAGAVLSRTFGRTAFLDELSKGIGNGDPAGFFNAINKLPANERADVVKQISAVEATNVGAVGGKDTAAAAQRVLKGMESYEGLSMSQFTHEEALNNMVNFAKAQRLADETAKRLGMPALTVGRVDARTLSTISESIVNAPAEDRLKAWDMLKKTAPNAAWANNENFDRQIKNLIARNENPSDLAAAIGRIKASFQVEGFPKSVSDELAKMGYIPIKPSNLEAPFAEGTGKVASKFGQNDEFFTKAVQPLPILSSLGKLVTNLGLSPYASQQRVYQIFNDNLSRNLQESGVIQKIMGEDAADSADTMIKKLSDYAHSPTRGRIVSKMPISDLRMLTRADIKTALNVSAKDAATIQNAIAQSFIQVPFAVRGLGDRLVDATYRIKPSGAIQRRYLRVMGAARFSWNPFFQYLRVIPKTETLAEFEGGGFVKSVFAGRYGELKNIRNGLRAGKFLDKESGFNAVSQEAADFGGSMSHNLSKKLLPAQEQSIAGLVDAQARRMGMDWQTYIKEYPQQVRDTIQAIAEYDRRGDFINSPLMRTLNIAFFPLRFDVKVAQIMARSLSKTSLMTQVSIVNGMLRAHDWLNSDEGKAWYSQNADVIGLLEYVSPFAKMNEVFQSLVPGHDHSLGNFGEVGGLPFGWIPQMLDSEGLTHFNQPGVNPKTGAIYQDYIPVTARGQLATALQDFIGSLYSYPGATIGLESKGKVNRFIAGSIIPTNTKRDFNVTTPNVSGEQQDYSSLIQQLSGTSPQQVKPFPTAPMRPGVSVPNTAPPMPTNKGPLSSKSSSTKKKKAQFTPELLPGQSTYGQL